MALSEQEELELLELENEIELENLRQRPPNEFPSTERTLPPPLYKRLLPSREEILPVAGATLGGIIGGGLSPAIGLASLFAGAGEAAKQLYQRGQKYGLPKIFRGQAPETSEEVAQLIAAQAALGGLGELGGRVIGKAFAPFSQGTTPEIRASIEAAKAEGIIPPLSARTKLPFLQKVERYAETSPFGAKIIGQREKALKGLEDFTDRIANQFGKDKPSEIRFGLVSETLKGLEQSWKIAKDSQYDIVLPKIINEKAELKNTIQTLENIIERRGGTAEPSGLNQIRKWLEEIKPQKGEVSLLIPESKGAVKTVGALRTFRSNVAKRAEAAFGDPSTTGIKSDLDNLYGAISKDIDGSIERYAPEELAKVKQADELFSQGIRTMKSGLFKDLQKVKPDNLHKVLIPPKMPEVIRTGRELLGEDVFNEVKRQWFDDLIDKSNIIQEGEKILSPQKLSTNIKNMREDTITELFSDNAFQAKKFQELEQIAGLLSRGGTMRTGTQTAFNLAGIVKTVINSFNAPVIGSEIGKKFLTTGFPNAEFAVRRSVQPAIEVTGQNIFNKRN